MVRQQIWKKYANADNSGCQLSEFGADLTVGNFYVLCVWSFSLHFLCQLWTGVFLRLKRRNRRKRSTGRTLHDDVIRGGNSRSRVRGQTDGNKRV